MERPIIVRNVDGMNNSGGVIIHQVEVNIYYEGHVERIRIDVYNLQIITMIVRLDLQPGLLEVRFLPDLAYMLG